MQRTCVLFEVQLKGLTGRFGVAGIRPVRMALSTGGVSFFPPFVIRESEGISPLACICVNGSSAVNGSTGEQGTRAVHGFTSLC